MNALTSLPHTASHHSPAVDEIILDGDADACLAMGVAQTELVRKFRKFIAVFTHTHCVSEW